MSLAAAILNAPDRDTAARIARDCDESERGPAVEEIAQSVLRELRVDARAAFESAERAEILARDALDGTVQARALWVKGHALAGLLRTGEAIHAYRDASRAYSRLGQPESAARIAIGEVNALTYQGQYGEALKLGRRARRRLVSTDQHDAAARLDMNLGNLYHRVEQPAKALRCYDRALRFARGTDDDAMAAVIRLNRATALSALGRIDEAEAEYSRAAEVAEREGQDRVRAFVDFNRGYLRFHRGEYDRAYDTLDAAREVFEAQSDDHFRTLTLVDLTELLLEVGSWTRAEATALEAQELTARLGLRYEQGKATLFRSIAQLGGGDARGAREGLETAAASFEEDGNGASAALCEVFLAELDLADRRGGDALRRLRRSAARFQTEGFVLQEAGARIALASALVHQRRLPPARAELDRAARLLRRAPSPWLRARRSHVAGRLEEAAGREGMALRHYRRAAGQLESLQGRLGIDEFRVSFADQRSGVWTDLVGLILRRGGPRAVADAFDLVERARSRSLVDLLAGRLTDVADDEASRSLLRRLENLRAELNRLRGFRAERSDGLRRSSPDPVRLRRCETEIADTVRRLDRRNASLGALAGGETYTLAEARRDLPADTELVEYFLAPDEGWALVVARDGARSVRLRVGARDIARSVARFRFQVEKCCHGPEYVRARRALLQQGAHHHLTALSDELWAPLELSAPRVQVVPHGALHAVPFAALPCGPSESVLDRHVVSFLPSASCRRYGSPSPPAGLRTILAVDAGVEDLPATRREVERVRRQFRRGRTLRGSSATRDRFRAAAPNADVIHLATHGLFREDDAAFSAVLLSDGWMGVHDVYGLRLRAELVCLSACQTGRSWVASGQEMVGLTRGFLHAGARSLLVSLWPVDDEATADLMEPFYESLKAGQPRDEALAQAMRRARALRPHPFYWAPFVLIGPSGSDDLGARSGRRGTKS